MIKNLEQMQVFETLFTNSVKIKKSDFLLQDEIENAVDEVTTY
jgi:hypothetical protein